VSNELAGDIQQVVKFPPQGDNFGKACPTHLGSDLRERFPDVPKELLSWAWIKYEAFGPTAS